MTTHTRFIGAHTIDTGGLDMAVRRAARSGMTAMQLFTAKPTFYNDKNGIRPERAERFLAALAGSGILARHVISHAGFVLNVSTADEEKWSRSNAGLTKELERATSLGLGAVCFHPGSAGDSAPSDASKRIARAIVEALSKVDGETRLLIENTAGAGRTMGRTAGEIAEMLSHVPAELRRRTGYGLDTCHLFSSGYDIRESPSAFVRILDVFEGEIGEPPSFFHLNDSQGALGTNRDRHALIGEGEIGVEPFRWLLQDRRSAGVPMILETPQGPTDMDPEDDTPDPFDERMMTLLRSLTVGG